jgi:hypothetical protein
MQAKGINGSLVELKAGLYNIWSEKCGCNISTNGDHQAIEVNGVVFDNKTLNGMDYNSWKNDLHAPIPINVSKTNF